jgi:UDP-N-acetylmuramoyl-tripeptide--D-alanyl-D-alanine ligase
MRNISIDSRTLEPGDIFIPVKGPNYDGHDFIPEAIKKGAQILDVDIPTHAKRYRKKLNCHVIGITGSAGKTTTKDLLYSVLSQRYTVVKTLENQNNELGAPLTVLRADDSTDILIVEMGMRGLGEIHHMAQIVRPTHAIITNIGMTHIERLETQRNIAVAKAEILVAKLPWERKHRHAFLNYKTPHYDLLLKKAKARKFQILPFGGEDRPEQNISLCFTVGRHFGLSDDEIHKGISSYKGSAHRMVRHHLRGALILDDSYNANPDGVAYALESLKRYKGRKILVLGDMRELGIHSKAAHDAIIPQAIDADVSALFCIGDETAHMESDELSISHFKTQTSLNSALKDEIKEGDVVLIKGSRGMKLDETVQYLCTVRA